MEILQNEIIQELIDTNLRKHLDDNGHKPASQPKIELKEGKLDQNTDLTFTFNYEILPVIPELNFDQIKLHEYKISVDNDAIQKALDEFQNRPVHLNQKKKMKKQNQETK